MTDHSDPTDGTDGPTAADARRAELIAGALADDLSPEESAELDALLAAEPDARTELAELQGLVDRSRAVLDGTRDARASDALRARVLRIPEAERADLAEDGPAARGVAAPAAPGRIASASARAADGVAARTRVPSRRRTAVALLSTAAACLALGAVIALGAQTLLSPAAVTGDPGTLGAVEPIDFAGEPSGVEIDAAVVAHTWGTETVLEIDGFAPGDAFDVVLIGTGGEALSSGGFLGSTVTIECRINAALLRDDVAAVEIRDARGAIVATAELPAVDS
ncbi:hypothetical protein OVN20_05655 [Microcella daejeonensis]|uniref:anti-sigma factor family protein n=1 Tax=Microcella daejeonensis TaxID=2994971 RepID=UPI00226DAD9E|nr:hypothetical protein [Microcella daejeonensis]WAB85035.1 hypothetical protein OVN20_05655 [Microcella daejeonensis]